MCSKHEIIKQTLSDEKNKMKKKNKKKKTPTEGVPAFCQEHKHVIDSVINRFFTFSII